MNLFPYYSFSQYLKSQFDFPVYKATIDAGFICPNMDGTKGVGGCTFCNNESFSPAFRVRKENIQEQLNKNIQRFLWSRKKIAKKNVKFLAFFQAFSGTYGPAEVMREWWLEALAHPQIVGLSVSTRADCLGSDVLFVLEEIAAKHQEIWLEIGVESTHDTTLQKVNRGHTYQEVIEAVAQCKKIPNLKICLHLIHGLPNETTEMMLESVKKINLLKPDAVKFHHLEIVKDTAMAKDFEKNPFPLFTLDSYFEVLGKSLQLLNKDIILQRLFSHSPEGFLIAPHWKHEKQQNQLFVDYLKINNITQGDCVK